VATEQCGALPIGEPVIRVRIFLKPSRLVRALYRLLCEGMQLNLVRFEDVGGRASGRDVQLPGRRAVKDFISKALLEPCSASGEERLTVVNRQQ
jgi:hypothetical protein